MKDLKELVQKISECAPVKFNLKGKECIISDFGTFDDDFFRYRVICYILDALRVESLLTAEHGKQKSTSTSVIINGVEVSIRYNADNDKFLVLSEKCRWIHAIQDTVYIPASLLIYEEYITKKYLKVDEGNKEIC